MRSTATAFGTPWKKEERWWNDKACPLPAETCSRQHGDGSWSRRSLSVRQEMGAPMTNPAQKSEKLIQNASGQTSKLFFYQN